MVWIIVVAVTIAVFLIILVTVLLLANAESGFIRSEIRPGYQDVIVRDAVDVKSLQYVSGQGEFFPEEDIKNMTKVLDSGRQRWQIVFTDQSSGVRYRISFDRSMVVGRCPIPASREPQLLVENDMLVSKIHCRISSTGRNIVIEDLCSHNGTYLDGERVRTKAPLSSGAILKVGNTKYQIRIYKV